MQSQNKRIVICCDGTWNKPDSQPTNVVKLVRGILPYANSCHQVVFYDQGVGTQGVFDKYIGGAFGVGVAKNILDAYRFIVHNYHEGDEIYCFGFSRGAYTARALGGLLKAIGLLPKSELETLSQAYSHYREGLTEQNKSMYESNHRPDIMMMGVWDTVGALGAPIPFLGSALNRRWVGFFDTTLSDHIKNAYHALAIDEKRPPFKPDLWTGSVKSDQTVEQRWFPGAHSNIGGGYADSGLSDIALMWMIDRARILGLEFDKESIKKIQPNYDGKLYDSYSKAFLLLEKVNKESKGRCLDGDASTPPINVTVDDSVRFREGYSSDSYASYVKNHQDDLRHSPREFTPGLVVNINFGDKEGRCEVVNQSETGLQLISDVNLSEPVQISTEQIKNRQAHIAWHRGNRYGLRLVA